MHAPGERGGSGSRMLNFHAALAEAGNLGQIDPFSVGEFVLLAGLDAQDAAQVDGGVAVDDGAAVAHRARIEQPSGHVFSLANRYHGESRRVE